MITGKGNLIPIFTLFALLVPCVAQSNRPDHPSKAALGGYVHDDNGKPVKGVLVTIYQGSYQTQGQTDVIPLIFPKATGAIVFDDPNVTNTHYINIHFTTTDSNGHYTLKDLLPGEYTFLARGMKKYVGDFRTTEGGLVKNTKLLARYFFPPADRVVINNGPTTVKDLILHSR